MRYCLELAAGCTRTGAGVSRDFCSHLRFIPVACDRSQGKYPARYMAVRAFSRSLGVYGICTDLYGFCTVFVRFCTEKRRKTGKNGHVRAAQGSARRPLHPRRAPGLQADPEFGERWQIALDTAADNLEGELVRRAVEGEGQ